MLKFKFKGKYDFIRFIEFLLSLKTTKLKLKALKPDIFSIMLRFCWEERPVFSLLLGKIGGFTQWLQVFKTFAWFLFAISFSWQHIHLIWFDLKAGWFSDLKQGKQKAGFAKMRKTYKPM